MLIKMIFSMTGTQIGITGSAARIWKKNLTVALFQKMNGKPFAMKLVYAYKEEFQ